MSGFGNIVRKVRGLRETTTIGDGKYCSGPWMYEEVRNGIAICTDDFDEAVRHAKSLLSQYGSEGAVFINTDTTALGGFDEWVVLGDGTVLQSTEYQSSGMYDRLAAMGIYGESKKAPRRPLKEGEFDFTPPYSVIKDPEMPDGFFVVDVNGRTASWEPTRNEADQIAAELNAGTNASQVPFPVESKLREVSPPGWGGTVKAMKGKDDIDNPWALAWHMKNQGDESHYKDDDSGEKKTESRIGEADMRVGGYGGEPLHIWAAKIAAMAAQRSGLPAGNLWEIGATNQIIRDVQGGMGRHDAYAQNWFGWFGEYPEGYVAESRRLREMTEQELVAKIQGEMGQLKSYLFRDDFDSYDVYGSVMQHFFGIAGALYAFGEDIPYSWNFSPGAMSSSGRPEEYPDGEYYDGLDSGEWSANDLRADGNLFDAWYDAAKEAGVDY